MARSSGWIPQQHGAWAMLLVPLAVGLARRQADGGLPAWAWPLAVTWLVGWFCFNALGLWLKAAPRRRRSYLAPLAGYGLLTAAAGITTLALDGLDLLWWLPVHLPLLGLALWLTARRRERSLLSGLCTVLATCLAGWIITFTTPQGVWQHGLDEGTWPVIGLFGYFFGTVFVVKTLIRERGSRRWVQASIGWHLAWTLLAVLARQAGMAGSGWVAFFLVGTVRAWALPWFGPRRGRTIRPAQVGMLEIVLSLVALALCLP